MTILETLDRIGRTTQVNKKAITELSVLNEAYDMKSPAHFRAGCALTSITW
jgi:hypothetical protein